MSKITLIYAGRTIEIRRGYDSDKVIDYRGRRTCNEASVPAEVIWRKNKVAAEQKLTRLLNTNFDANCFHVILTYPRETEPLPEDANELFKKFLRRLRYQFVNAKKNTPNVPAMMYVYASELKLELDDEEFEKWMAAIVVCSAKNGVSLKDLIEESIVKKEFNNRIHHHLIINAIPGVDMMALFKKLWPHGLVKVVQLKSDGQYRKLAEYIIKETDKTFRLGMAGMKKRFQTSRGLKKAIVKKIDGAETDFPADPVIPEGYYLDNDTLFNGVHPIYPDRKVQKYTLIKLLPEE